MGWIFGLAIRETHAMTVVFGHSIASKPPSNGNIVSLTGEDLDSKAREVGGFGATPEMELSLALKQVVTKSAISAPFEVGFKVAFVSLTDGQFDPGIPDANAFTLTLEGPNEPLQTLINIRLHEIWPGGRTTPSAAVVRDSAVMFKTSGNYSFRVVTEYCWFSGWGSIAYGSMLNIIWKGTSYAVSRWLPTALTQNGVPVDHSYPLTIP